MSERTRDLGAATLFGRRVEEVSVDPDAIGRVGPLTEASPDVIAFVKRHAEQLDAERFGDQQGMRLVDAETGIEYEVVRTHVDWAQDESDIRHFVVRDGLICPLREAGSTERSTTTAFGTVGARMARPDDPIPLGDGPVIW